MERTVQPWGAVVLFLTGPVSCLAISSTRWRGWTNSSLMLILALILVLLRHMSYSPFISNPTNIRECHTLKNHEKITLRKAGYYSPNFLLLKCIVVSWAATKMKNMIKGMQWVSERDSLEIKAISWPLFQCSQYCTMLFHSLKGGGGEELKLQLILYIYKMDKTIIHTLHHCSEDSVQ